MSVVAGIGQSLQAERGLSAAGPPSPACHPLAQRAVPPVRGVVGVVAGPLGEGTGGAAEDGLAGWHLIASGFHSWAA
jgi:hypothetical protein